LHYGYELHVALQGDLSNNWSLFDFQLANNEADEVCTVALKVIFDLFLLYGLQAFQIEETGTGKENGMLGTCKLLLCRVSLLL
jgi:hypothetical protein